MRKLITILVLLVSMGAGAQSLPYALDRAPRYIPETQEDRNGLKIFTVINGTLRSVYGVDVFGVDTTSTPFGLATKGRLYKALDSLSALKQNSITLTTTGTSGSATLVGSTLNIPQYSGTTYSGNAPIVVSGSTISADTSMLATRDRVNKVADSVLSLIPSLSRSSITLTTTGTGGTSTYNSSTGALNIPVIPTNNNQLTNGSGYITGVTTTDNNLTASGSVVGTNKVPQTLTDGATITWNVNNGYNAVVTLAGNRTLAITNVQAGSYGTLRVVQDSTGSRTITLPASSRVINGGAGAITLTTTGGASDLLVFYYNGEHFYFTIGRNYN